MKFGPKQKLIALVSSILIILSFFGWKYIQPNTLIRKFAAASFFNKDNRASTKMTYGRFLEYLDMGWVKTVDFYDYGRTAIIEASSPELGDRVQKIRVEIPLGSSQLIMKLRESKIDFTAHPKANYNFFFNILRNLFLPFVILAGIFYLFRRTASNFINMSGPGQFMNFRKARAKVQMYADTGVGFSDVAGIDEAKEEFEEVVSFLQNPQRFTIVGAEIPKGMILIGPPGTGKTLLAKAIAGEAGVPFISISGSEFIEMFVGIGASRVRDLFKTAKQNAPCIVFIDEIDAVGRKRGTGVGAGNDEREQTLNQILTEMDGFKDNTGVMVIAATNRADTLDSALLRPGRFDREVNINLPDVKGRLEILKVHARNKKMKENVSLDIIAKRTPGFSGADLANLLNEAAIITARRNKTEVSMDEVNTAIDRIIAGLEGTSLTDTKNKRLIAYHEIGHAIIGTLLEDHEDMQKVTLIPRGQARGLTWFMPNEDQILVSRNEIVAKIIGTLGGRAAEDVIFGITELTTGASNDLKQVTNLALNMVTRFGMSPLGPIAIKIEQQPNLLRRMMSPSKYFSKNKVDRVVSETQLIVNQSYAQAVNIIKKNRVVIDLLVDKLIQEETIEGEDFREFIKLYTPSSTKIKNIMDNHIIEINQTSLVKI